jgi:nucleotide-binding universal stress UspA family protein
MRKVVIPLEVSEISSEILPVVRHLFKPGETEITLVAVAQPPAETPIVADSHMMAVALSASSMVFSVEECEAERKELQSKLETVAVDLRSSGYKVYTTVLTGATVEAIANFVEKRNFDLLAMATYGRTGVNRLVYGSIAEALLRRVSIPLLLLRHQPNSAHTGKRVRVDEHRVRVAYRPTPALVGF